MNRFFCNQSDIANSKIIISDTEQRHHIKDVLRLKVGDEAVIVDEHGNEHLCKILEMKDKISFDIINKNLFSAKADRIKLTIACAIPKKAKIDDIIDKLVQLGVDRIIPLKTERVIVKLNKRKEALRFERWERIALSASRQSQRRVLPVIDPVRSFAEVLVLSPEFDLKLIPHLLGKRQGLKDIFLEHRPRNILALVGPEGDFSGAEVKLAIKAGFIPVTLGGLVLRVDTAAIAIASFIRLYACD